jgi:peptide deformylase
LVRFGGEQTGAEGCLSIPGWIGEVTRYSRVTVRAQDLNGKEIRVKATDYLARVLQHEIDHLDGILFTDRMADPTALERVETPPAEAARHPVAGAPLPSD